MAQTLEPTNATDPRLGTMRLSYITGGSPAPMANLIPLTDQAMQLQSTGISGQIVLTTTSYTIAAGQIAYIDCEPADYPGNIGAINVTQVAEQKQVAAVILYSAVSMMCNYTPAAGEFSYLYSMASVQESTSVLNTIQRAKANGPLNVQIATATNTTNDAGTPTSSAAAQSSTAPSGLGGLGSTPSTAVAMIILYSITGVITSLFLIIIVTGAVRAHRHPERYGPRAGIGRPRQSRAKGIARAMLETLPIVKFGQDDDDARKPNSDVELAAARGEAASHTEAESSSRAEPRDTTAASEPRDTTPPRDEAGSTDTDTPVATAAAAAAATSAPESLSCSICTEDFNRGEDIRLLPCKHAYHPACIDPWLLNVSGTCPLCRIDLRPARTSGESNAAVPAAEGGVDDFAPPLDEPRTDVSSSAPVEGARGVRESRRLSVLRDMLALGSAEERREALRRLRDRRQSVLRETEAPAALETTGDVEDSRSRRVAGRLRDAFGIATRRAGLLMAPARERNAAREQREIERAVSISMQARRRSQAVASPVPEEPVQESAMTDVREEAPEVNTGRTKKDESTPVSPVEGAASTSAVQQRDVSPTRQEKKVDEVPHQHDGEKSEQPKSTNAAE